MSPLQQHPNRFLLGYALGAVYAASSCGGDPV